MYKLARDLAAENHCVAPEMLLYVILRLGIGKDSLSVDIGIEWTVISWVCLNSVEWLIFSRQYFLSIRILY